MLRPDAQHAFVVTVQRTAVDREGAHPIAAHVAKRPSDGRSLRPYGSNDRRAAGASGFHFSSSAQPPAGAGLNPAACQQVV
jgi:hypothetical protein